VTPKGM
jgi:hypothetical protein